MWTRNFYTIPSDTDKVYNFPEIKVEMTNDIFCISQEDSDNEDFDTVDLTVEQALKLKSVLEQYLQGK
ncbi:hypothetical protein RGZ1_81 [Morganella phage vB_MmoM_Rgz1]|nr:hypothetical protein RGZ1_81 [Morganella phage vB_MmoM_Rgz1]